MDKGMKILVVDDSSTARRVISSFLRTLGFFNLEEADDGVTALPMLRSRLYDLLITDEYMPGMRGVELLKTVRADPELAGLPVLMITVESGEDFICEAARAGVDAFVVKPFSAQTLEYRISQIFEREVATA